MRTFHDLIKLVLDHGSDFRFRFLKSGFCCGGAIQDMQKSRTHCRRSRDMTGGNIKVAGMVRSSSIGRCVLEKENLAFAGIGWFYPCASMLVAPSRKIQHRPESFRLIIRMLPDAPIFRASIATLLRLLFLFVFSLIMCISFSIAGLGVIALIHRYSIHKKHNNCKLFLQII